MSRLHGRFTITAADGKTFLSSIPVTKCCVFGHKFKLIAASTSQIMCWAEEETFPGRVIELMEHIYDLTSSDAALTVMSTAHFWRYNARMELVKKINHQMGPAKLVADDSGAVWVGDMAGRVRKLTGNRFDLVDTFPAPIQQATLKDSRILFKTFQGRYSVRDGVQGQVSADPIELLPNLESLSIQSVLDSD